MRNTPMAVHGLTNDRLERFALGYLKYSQPLASPPMPETRVLNAGNSAGQRIKIDGALPSSRLLIR